MDSSIFNKIRKFIDEEKKIEKLDKNNIKDMSKIVKMTIEFLGCKCKYYPPTNEDNYIISGYIESLRRSKTEKFIPVIISVSDTLLNNCFLNTVVYTDDELSSILDYDLEQKEKDYFNFYQTGILSSKIKQEIEKYRENIISNKIKNGKEELDIMINKNKNYFGGYEIENEDSELEYDKDEENVKKDYSSYSINREIIKGIWEDNDKCDKTKEVLIAEIPVENPWEIFAYIPFGGWNDCPSNENIISISKYWYEKYGAIPLVISKNTLEYILESPIKKFEKIRFAEEFYAFCPDRVDKYMFDFNLKKLADYVEKCQTWYFVWN